MSPRSAPRIELGRSVRALAVLAVTIATASMMLLPSPCRATPPPLEIERLEAGACHFFGSFGPTGSSFLALLQDGSYVRIMRAHLGVQVSDTGDWAQEPEGTVYLRSEESFRDIEHGPLSIYLGSKGPGEFLEKVRGELARFLEKRGELEFEPETVRAIHRFPSPVAESVILDGIKVDILFELEGGKVRRADLEALLEKIDRYVGASDQQEFRFVPLRYGATTLLEWQNDGTPIQRNRQRMMAEIDEADASGRVPGFFYVGIPPSIFGSEAATTQPFIYYTELNEGRAARRLGTVDVILERCAQGDEDD